jgi:hypothetical protein
MASSIDGLHEFFLHHSSLPILPFLHISRQLMRFAGPQHHSVCRRDDLTAGVECCLQSAKIRFAPQVTCSNMGL